MITIWTIYEGRPLSIDMPAVTTAEYAAKRIAESMGFDHEPAWRVLDHGNQRLIGQDQIMEPWHDRWVDLVVPA